MTLWMIEVVRTWRSSLRRPGFLTLAAGVLALGMAASAAVFTLIDGVLLKPLPYVDPSRLVLAGPLENGLARHGTGHQYLQLDGLPGMASRGLMLQLPILSNVAGNGLPEAVTTVHVDRGVLPTLGVAPLLGRNFNAQEDVPHGVPAVILSYGFWMRRFGGAQDVLGKSGRHAARFLLSRTDGGHRAAAGTADG
jgi:putative ABC transport system permease protein